MKNNTASLVFTVILTLFLNIHLFGQNRIRFGKDQCTHCSMVLRDQLHVAVLTDKNGKIYKFDAIECMINYVKKTDKDKFDKLEVADYGKKGKLIDAEKATYLQSKGIPSPMGAFLSAFGERSVAQKVLSEKGGELFSWEEIKLKFKEVGFGTKIHQHFRPDAYAPIGIMGDHLHHKGGFMMSLRYMNMGMTGNMNGVHSVNSENILTKYMASPENMNMQMYMLGVMYAPSNHLTITVMQNFSFGNMDMVNRMGNEFSTKSAGLGDMKLSVLYLLMSKEHFSFHLNSALNIPIGKTNVTDDTPVADDMKLPYSMQLGSGTVDFSLGGTLKGHEENWSWGVQQMNMIRTGTNAEGYRPGNRFELNTWAAIKALDWLSFSGRLQGVVQGSIRGIDDELNPMMSPAANASNYGDKKIKTYLGANISFPQYSALKRIKMGVEVGLPVYENYTGIQMDENGTLLFGLRYTSL